MIGSGLGTFTGHDDLATFGGRISGLLVAFSGKGSAEIVRGMKDGCGNLFAEVEVISDWSMPTGIVHCTCQCPAVSGRKYRG